MASKSLSYLVDNGQGEEGNVKEWERDERERKEEEVEIERKAEITRRGRRPACVRDIYLNVGGEHLLAEDHKRTPDGLLYQEAAFLSGAAY
jgi:hypothetical protein